MKPTQYIRCPRCELNYIQKKDKYCAVCKAEMSAKKEDFIDDLDLDLCPICKTNYIQSDEVMCPSCLKERGIDEDDEVAKTQSDEWDNYVEQDENSFIMPNEETGDLTIADMDDLDEDDLSLVDDGEFEDDDEESEEENDDDDFDDFDDSDDIDDDDDDDEDDDE